MPYFHKHRSQDNIRNNDDFNVDNNEKKAKIEKNIEDPKQIEF